MMERYSLCHQGIYNLAMYAGCGYKFSISCNSSVFWRLKTKQFIYIELLHLHDEYMRCNCSSPLPNLY